MNICATVVNTEGIFTTEQISTLTNIADQCRYEGGYGVALSRVALGQPSAREEECKQNSLEESEDRGALGQSINALLYPNPASEQAFQIQLDRVVLDGSVRLIDLRGRVVGTWNFSGSALDVQYGQVVPGVYMVEVLERDHILNRSKLIINR